MTVIDQSPLGFGVLGVLNLGVLVFGCLESLVAVIDQFGLGFRVFGAIKIVLMGMLITISNGPGNEHLCIDATPRDRLFGLSVALRDMKDTCSAYRKVAGGFR